MTVVEKAKELGLMLAESEEFIRMRTAEQARQADPDAQILLAAYNTARTEISARARREDVTPDEMQAIRNDMEREYGKLQKNAAITEYIGAMSAFNDLMRGVNAAIASYISPEQGDCGCGGDCGGCGGGCR
ncbi:MAG: YlbF family regulator [Clostridiales bacterium]|jgi:cell fate (sporulation/competence/biofilm development) regulator YlbF (YheA/YmcA/DUF963 family)|nr:YlbF family regulator [Clostridiales bacterium]